MVNTMQLSKGLALALSTVLITAGNSSGFGLQSQVNRAVLGTRAPRRPTSRERVQTAADLERINAAKAKRLKREQRNLANTK